MFDPTAGCSSGAFRRCRGFGIDDGGQRAVLDRDPLGGVLCEVAVLRQHDRDRLADMAHPIDRQAPLLHRGLDRDGEGPRPAAGILAGHDAGDTRHRQRRRGIDRDQLGMRIGRAQDRGMQRAARHRQIVGEPARPSSRSASSMRFIVCLETARLIRFLFASAIVGPLAAARQARPRNAPTPPSVWLRGGSTPMLNPHRFMLFTALAALFTASALDPAAAVTPTSPNKDQTVGKASPQTVPEDPATSGSSTEPLSESSIARAA